MSITETAPDNDNYLLGGVRIYIRKSGASAYNILGNATNVTMNNNPEYLDHYTSWSGKRRKDRKDKIGEEFTLEFTLDEFNSDNMGLFFGSSADAIAYSQTSGSQASTDVTALVGKSLKLSHRNITNGTFTAAEGSTSLTEGTDYELDYEQGIITFLAGSAIVEDSDTISIEYDYGAIEGEQFYPGTVTNIQEIDSFYISVIGNSGEVYEWNGTSATISANGSLSIGDTDYSNMPFRIDILATNSATQPYGTWRMWR